MIEQKKEQLNKLVHRHYKPLANNQLLLLLFKYEPNRATAEIQLKIRLNLVCLIFLSSH